MLLIQKVHYRAYINVCRPQELLANCAAELGHIVIRLEPDHYVPQFGCTVGEELLRPTDIYVRPIMDLLNKQHLPIRALVNITSDGLSNLARIDAAVGFNLDNLPEPQPIFSLIQQLGNVPAPEMYQVFNMGIGFCLIVPDDRSVLRAVDETFARY